MKSWDRRDPDAGERDPLLVMTYRLGALERNDGIDQELWMFLGFVLALTYVGSWLEVLPDRSMRVILGMLIGIAGWRMIRLLRLRLTRQAQIRRIRGTLRRRLGEQDYACWEASARWALEDGKG